MFKVAFLGSAELTERVDDFLTPTQTTRVFTAHGPGFSRFFFSVPCRWNRTLLRRSTDHCAKNALFLALLSRFLALSRFLRSFLSLSCLSFPLYFLSLFPLFHSTSSLFSCFLCRTLQTNPCDFPLSLLPSLFRLCSAPPHIFFLAFSIARCRLIHATDLRTAVRIVGWKADVEACTGVAVHR